MTSIGRAARVLAAVALGAGLGACGGTGAGARTPDGGPGLPRSVLAARADAICAGARTRTGSGGAPGTLYSDAAAAAAYFDRIYPITDQETKQLEALMPTRGAAGDWRAFVSAETAADQLLATLKRYADVKNPKGLAYLADIQPAGERVAAAARRLGARVCAGG